MDRPRSANGAARDEKSKPRRDAGSQALRKHKDRDWNFQVLRCIERGQRQAATERSPGSKLMLRLATRALRSEFDDMQQLASAVQRRERRGEARDDMGT